MSGNNFPDWWFHVSGRKKLAQILIAFADCIGPETPKYVCAPCSNRKGQIRDMLAYGGLAELIVNAVTDVKPGYTERERH